MARKILLADDSVTAQNMGRKILADAGYDVVTVNNGSAALKRIAEIKPDLIVLDVYMPGYSGLEVCQRLKDAAETAHIPVLLTVGKLEPFKAEEARRVRADAHIVKPFEASELLTAITRLEDRMVPQQSEGGRFSTSVSGVERFGGEENDRRAESKTDADTGWKSRLRFPSKKKKEEPETESQDDATGATFRDFRKGKGKTAASAPFTVKAPAPPGQEPGLVPDIPRDITPEELDALSALAEKLDGPIPAAENIAPLAEKMGPVEVSPAEGTAAKTFVEAPATAVEATKETETVVPVVEPAPVVEAPALVAEQEPEIKIPVKQVELANEAAALVADPPALEIKQRETQQPDAERHGTPLPEPQAVAAVAVDTGILAHEPAPVDRNDEPIFGLSGNVVELATKEQIEEKIDEKIEDKSAEAVANSVARVSADNAPGKIVADPESESEGSELQEVKTEEPKSEELKADAAQPVTVAASVPEPEEPAPSDEELAEALRLLTPATGHADVATIPSHGTLVAAGQLLAEEAARNAAPSPRWIAEPVALGPEEAGISLEAEMFRTFAATYAAEPLPSATTLPTTSGAEVEATRRTGVSAIAAAVENRLAEAGLAARPKAQVANLNASERGSQKKAAEEPAEAPAELAVAGSNAASSSIASPEVEKVEPAKVEAATIEPERLELAKIEAEQKDFPLKIGEEAPADEVAAATFADAIGKDENGADAQSDRLTVSAMAAATASAVEGNQDSSSDAEGEESMGKDTKSKSGKSNWHQIHTAPSTAAAGSDVVEAAKQAEDGAEEPRKAMAAAAAADGGAAPISATDPSTIASIVDSVMADLRPKIVEEIARKLAGK